MLILIHIIGQLLTHTPSALLRGLCICLGHIIYWFAGERKTAALRSMHHGIPNEDDNWRRAAFKESCNRTVEMALLVMALPYLSSKRVSKLLQPLDEVASSHIDDMLKDVPVVLLLPHFTLSEATVTLPLHASKIKGKTSTIFRPLNNPKLNHWVEKSRSRFGVNMISRKNGYSAAIKELEKNNAVALLFDQNASGKGSLVHMMDRVTSATELPGLLAHKKNALTYVAYPERIGFWQARMHFIPIDRGTHPIHVTLAANDWLEDYLRSSVDHCADWLWLHNRWGSPQNPRHRFHLKDKRNRLKEEAIYRNNVPHKRPTSVWLNLPEREADFLDLSDMVRKVRQIRPDYALCLIGRHTKETMRAHFGTLPDKIVELTANPEERLIAIRQIATDYPDVWINLQTSRQSLKESRASQAHQRFGIDNIRNARKHLTHLAPGPTDTWKPFFEKFGLRAEEDA